MATSLLLADDSPTIAKILTLALAQDDYSVKSVLTAAEAEKELLSSHPEIFLVDISLPEKDAFQLAKIIRSNPDTAKTKIVFLANSFEPVNDAACIAAGADAVIMKPFDPAELRRKLKEVKEAAVNISQTSTEPAPVAEPALPTPPPQTTQQIKSEPAASNEELSPNAKELAKFFEAEVEANKSQGVELVLTPSNETTSIALDTEMPANVALAKSLAQETPNENSDAVDLSAAMMDWAPATNSNIAVEPPPKEALANWKTAKKSSTAMFDTGKASFRFSQDYVTRISKAFELADGLEHELSGAEQFNPDKTNFGSESDVHAVEELRDILEARGKVSEQPLESVARAPTPLRAAPAIAINRADMEEIVRDEVRMICKSVVERVAWEMIPELAENIIRQELEKVMKELDPHT